MTLDKLKDQLADADNLDVISLFKWANNFTSNVSLWGMMHWVEMIKDMNDNENKSDGVEKLEFVNSYLMICEKLSRPKIVV
jgi:hypothetical protein